MTQLAIHLDNLQIKWAPKLIKETKKIQNRGLQIHAITPSILEAFEEDFCKNLKFHSF